MDVVITPSAEAQIENQLRFSTEQFGSAVASRTLSRIENSFALLGEFPRSGRRRQGTALYETAIPRTPFVVIYRIEDNPAIVRILGFFHAAQDRSEFEPE